MAGTKAGGALAAKTNKEKYGEDFYKRIGSEGGKNGHTGGFYANRELARTAGAKGGRKSRRNSAQNNKDTIGAKVEKQTREDLLQNDSGSERRRSNWLLRHFR